MELTIEEKEMLDGKHGNAVKKSMEILTALGNIFGAKRMIDVESVQISGVSYHNLGDAGLSFLDEMAKDGKTRILTTLNPAGMDMENWQALGISEDFAKKQEMVINAFKKMGVIATCTCTPYFIGNIPKFNDHLAWGESSAVTFANSVIGARTNREGGPSTIASALTGKTPEYGLHLDENRQAQILVEFTGELKSPRDFGALGHVVGKQMKGRIPLIRGIKKASIEDMKTLSAAIVTYGSAPLFHIEELTPNKTTVPEEKMGVTQDDINKAIEELSDATDVDFIFIGCPHCSLKEIEKIARIVEAKTVNKEFWVGVARPVKKIADDRGYSKIIQDAGIKFACDTCCAVAPLKGMFTSMATNSAKGIYYGRGSNNFKTVLKTVEECIKIATES